MTDGRDGPDQRKEAGRRLRARNRAMLIALFAVVIILYVVGLVRIDGG
jgi:hypothetical protein